MLTLHIYFKLLLKAAEKKEEKNRVCRIGTGNYISIDTF